MRRAWDRSPLGYHGPYLVTHPLLGALIESIPYEFELQARDKAHADRTFPGLVVREDDIGDGDAGVLLHKPHGHFLAITYATPVLADETIVKAPDVSPTLPA